MRSVTTFISIAGVLALGLPGTALAAVIGPWPATSTNFWETQPLAPYTSGAVTLVAPDSMQMAAPTGLTKTTWLPYGGTYAEKMTLAQLTAPRTPITAVHARIYDPVTAGKSGWAVILEDSDGRILDIGIRGFFASQQILAHQYDGSTWANGPASTRTRTGNNYYGLDFTQLTGGTIQYTISANENGTTWSYTNTTTVAYGNIDQLYLNVMTPDTSGAGNYKWTEFSYTPDPATIALLAMGAMAGLGRRRR